MFMAVEPNLKSLSETFKRMAQSIWQSTWIQQILEGNWMLMVMLFHGWAVGEVFVQSWHRYVLEIVYLLTLAYWILISFFIKPRFFVSFFILSVGLSLWIWLYYYLLPLLPIFCLLHREKLTRIQRKTKKTI